MQGALLLMPPPLPLPSSSYSSSPSVFLEQALEHQCRHRQSCHLGHCWTGALPRSRPHLLSGCRWYASLSQRFLFYMFSWCSSSCFFESVFCLISSHFCNLCIFPLHTLTYHCVMPTALAGALLVYDITDSESFVKVKNWVKELRKMVSHCHSKARAAATL
jgi:hypothetical protein